TSTVREKKQPASASLSNRPADLGYYLGYQITESYYNNSDNKKQAIKEILEMKNAEKFLEKSKYDK
ncbi:MAG TPA: hypothetical protein VNJ50_06130, partial [Gelidibacter sp.]|nr:hypothetical protein [Gelidibacter sp.]